jgi:hypothetical protein
VIRSESARQRLGDQSSPSSYTLHNAAPTRVKEGGHDCCDRDVARGRERFQNVHDHLQARQLFEVLQAKAVRRLAGGRRAKRGGTNHFAVYTRLSASGATTRGAISDAIATFSGHCLMTDRRSSVAECSVE